MTQVNKGAMPGPAARLRPDLFWALGLAAVSLAVMIAYNFSAHPDLHPDFERYVGVAQGIGSFDLHRAFNFHYPPLYPLFLALLNPLIGFEPAARVVNIVATAATVVPLYFLALFLFGRRAAILTGIFFALRFFDKNSIVKAEQLSILLIYSGILIGFYAMKSGDWRRCLAAGVAFGLAFLTKPEASAYFLAFVGLSVIEIAWLAITHNQVRAVESKAPEGKKKKKKTAPAELPQAFVLKPRLLALGLAFAGYFIITGPYLASYTAATGKLSLNPKGGTLFKIHNYLYGGGELYRLNHDDAGYFTYAQRIYIDGDRVPMDLKDFPRPGFGAFMKVYFQRFGQGLKKHLVGWYLQPMLPFIWVPLLVLGLWPHLRAGRWRNELYLTAYGLIPVFSVPVFSSSYERFYFTMAPWLILVLANGLNRALELTVDRLPAGKKTVAERAAVGATALALVVMAAVQLSRSKGTIDASFEFRKQPGTVLKALLKGDCRFLAELDKPSEWLLAEVPMDRQESLPITDLDGLVALAKDTKAKYIYLHSFRFPGRFQAFIPMLAPGFRSPDFREVYRAIGPGGDPNVIYEILPVKCGE
jgi:4-amino-4-deoxy-L-arabinose transferase-like glycosyltransferase